MRTALRITIWAIAALALVGCAEGVVVEYIQGADDATVLMDGGLTLTVPVENIEVGDAAVTVRTDGGLTLTVPREHVSGLENIPKWLGPRPFDGLGYEYWAMDDANWPTGEYLSKVKLSQPPTRSSPWYANDNTITIALDYNGRCDIINLTKEQQAETFAMLDVGDTVTVRARELGGWGGWDKIYSEDLDFPFLHDCSILAIEKGRDPIPWSDVWNEGWNDTYRKVRQSVVGVEAANGGGNCAGWVYADGWVITAEHCVEGESVVEILYADDAGRTHVTEGQVMGWDRLRDIAAVKLPDGVDLPAFELVEFTDEQAKHHLMLMGYSGRLDYPDASSGEFVGIRDRRGAGVLILEAALPSIGGDSGGVYVDRDGYAVGIHQASSHFLNNGLGLPISEIEKVWERLKAGEQLNGDGPGWWAY